MKKTIRIIAVAMVALMLMLTLTSCGKPNSDPDKALDALKENGIALAAKDTTITPAALMLLGVKDIDCVVSGTGKTNDGENATITVIYFEDSSAAKDAFDKVKEWAEEDNDDSDFVFKRSGAMIYFGNKAGVKAAS